MSPITVQSEYFHCINGVFYPPLPQQVYQLDSFIEFIGRLPTVTTGENRIRVHYVGYQKLNDTFMHFDDTRVNHVLLDHEYKVNLLFYKRANTPAVNWPMDLELIPMYNNPPPPVPPSKAIEPKRPNPSLRPPLITPTTSGTSCPKPALKDESPSHPDHPRKDLCITWMTQAALRVKTWVKTHLLMNTHHPRETVCLYTCTFLSNISGSLIYVHTLLFPNTTACHHPLLVVIFHTFS